MWEFIIGSAIGAGAVIAKDTLMDSKKEMALKEEIVNLQQDYEKLRKRNKEAERLIEDLQTNNERLHRQLQEQKDNEEDLQYNLQTAQSKIAQQEKVILDLQEQVEEYRSAYQSLKANS